MMQANRGTWWQSVKVVWVEHIDRFPNGNILFRVFRNISKTLDISILYWDKLGIQLLLCHLCQRRNNLRLEKLDLTSLIIVSSLKACFVLFCFLNLELHVLVIVYICFISDLMQGFQVAFPLRTGPCEIMSGGFFPCREEQFSQI